MTNEKKRPNQNDPNNLTNEYEIKHKQYKTSNNKLIKQQQKTTNTNSKQKHNEQIKHKT